MRMIRGPCPYNNRPVLTTNENGLKLSKLGAVSSDTRPLAQ